MPVLVPVDELVPGMRLAEPLKDDNRLLLAAGKPLTDVDVGVLGKRFADRTLRIADPILDEAITFQDDARDREMAAACQRRAEAVIEPLAGRFAAGRPIGAREVHEVQAAVSGIADLLARDPVTAAFVDHHVSDDGYLRRHAANASYLALVLGSAVRAYVLSERQRQTALRDLRSRVALDLVPLGLGTLLMDVGMYAIADLLDVDRPLDGDERALVRDHPIHGAELLPDTLPSGVKMIVKTHHESFDGSGYPRAIAGEKLHVFTRIARIVDSFDAATSRRMGRDAKSPARVLWEMSAGPHRHCYDPVLVEVFARLVQPFAIGTKLRLAGGEGAVVVRHHESEPFRPWIVVASDERGTPIPRPHLGAPVELGSSPRLRAVAHGSEDLRFLGDVPPATETTAPRRPLETLFAALYP